MHKEVIKEVTVGVSEEELSKVRGRVEVADRRRRTSEHVQTRGAAGPRRG